MGWTAALICLVLGTATAVLERAPPGVGAPNLQLDIAPLPNLIAVRGANCEFNGQVYAIAAQRETPNGIYVCQLQAGKAAWAIKSCTYRDKQVPLMVETRFGNETVVCAQQKLPDGTLNFVIKRTWPGPGPAVSATKPTPAPPVPKPPVKPCPIKAKQTVPTAKPLPFTIKIVGDFTMPPLRATAPADVVVPGISTPQPSQTVSPSVDPTNCGSIADLKPLRDDKCYKKYSADPSGTCAKYAGSDHDYMKEGPFVGTYCACKIMFAQSGFNCTGGCNLEERQALQCPGTSPCYLDDQNQNRPACRCINGYKLEQGKCIRQFNYCDTCEFNCHFSQKCQDTGNRESGTGYTCGPCSEEMGFESAMGGGLTGWCQNTNECSNGKHKCEPKATCIDKDPTYANGTKYLCQCKAGWEGVGTTCSPCTDVNECLIPNICGKNSDCTNTPGSYSCKCRTGYKPGGSTYSEQGHQDCVDSDECAESPPPCKAFSQCNNTEGSYECPCNRGYVGDGKVRGCKLDDSICATCDKKTTKCGVNSAETAYECQCVANHTAIAGNSTHCKPVTYCDKGAAVIKCAPSPKSTCTDNPDGSGYTCKCNEGYVDEGTGDLAGKGYACYSEDPCERYSPCATVAHAFCNRTNRDKGYTCICRDGYVRQLAGQGNDSAPCYEATGPEVYNCTQCRPNSEICTTVTGDNEGHLMQCTCAAGYKRPEGEDTGGYGECLNVNECRDTALHDCDTIRALCIDEYPSKENNNTKFTCKCLHGYRGSGKVNDCHNINECNETPDICGSTKICEDRNPGYKCICAPGFTQSKTDPDKCEDIDECVTSLGSCNAYATCVNTHGSYKCICDIEKNFKENGTNEKGVTCGIINVCKEGLQGKGVKACPDPHHICTQDGNSHYCKCPEGFAPNGQTCDGIDECRDEQKNDCDVESTTCVDKTPGYECRCIPNGYEPIPNNTKSCQDKNECERPGSPCNPNTNCINMPGTYRCVCKDGYVIAPGGTPNSPYCQPKNPCLSSINPCYGGDCQYDPTKPPFYTCICNYGLMIHNGTTCIDSKYCDETDTYKCPAYSTCKNRQCECDSGYQWTTVQMPLTMSTFSKRACTAINWCTVFGPKNCKQRGLKCRTLDKPGTGECYCDAGFREGPDGCGNINECIESQAKGESICPAHSDCKDTPGSYKCDCSDGYYADSEKTKDEAHPFCIDLDECEFEQHNCSLYKNTKCNNLEGRFECICKTGYKPTQIGGSDYGSKSNRDCEWQDPCENDPCEENAVCNSSSGCAVCQCPPGYHGTGTKEKPCLDNEECATGRDNCTRSTEDCVELPGSFKCDCKKGFEKNANGVCEDVNECRKTPTICMSQKNSICNNTIGSYVCVCKTGFVYDPKTKTCVDYKDCSEPNKCGPSPGNTCVEKEGSYDCICDPGYQRPCTKGNKNCHCHNINECDNATACDKNAWCTDTPGSYVCRCKDNYKGSSEDARKPGGCKYVPICDRNKCELPNTHCVPKNEESFECICNDGYIKQKSTGTCVKNPCGDINCDGGVCIPRQDKGDVVPDCNCNNGQIYNNKTDKCVPSNVCQCPEGKVSCKNSPVCDDPPRQTCTPNGAEPRCQCETWLQPNPKTKKCENCDDCIGRCPPGATRTLLKNSLGDNHDRICICQKGFRWERDYQNPFNPGKCVVDTDCSLDAYCNHKLGMVCVDGICVCDTSQDFSTNINGSCFKIDACERDRQQGKETCKGPGTIPDGRGDYCICNCELGYEKDCIDGKEICKDIKECSQRPHPCYNRTDKPYCVEKPGSYECTCNGTVDTQGYVINENGVCGPPDLCKTRAPCPEHSSCISSDGSCVCDPGFTDRGDVTVAKRDPICEDINECLSSATYVCPENARCNNTIGDYDCICETGYEQVDAKPWVAQVRNLRRIYNYTCNDINECETKENACANDTRITCVNYPGDYNCTCDISLGQINSKECSGRLNATSDVCPTCSPFSVCAVVIGQTAARNCSCIQDYEGNGIGKDGCKPIQYCGRKPKVCVDIAKCRDTNPGYNCDCPDGYEGDGKMRGIGCTLINFCAKQNPCPKDANCTSLGATPQWTADRVPAKAWTTCRCRDGYEFDRETFTCKDVNECELKKQIIDADHTPCPRNATCINTQGSFTCDCPSGRTYNTLMNSCDDINECKTGLADSCKPATGDCQNTDGSWVCNCKPGYEHKVDNDKICEYVDKCTTPQNPCNETTSICRDAYDSGLICECKKGYQQDPNTQYKCVDINECTFPNDCNYLTQTCENTDGGYNCHCRVGYIEENGECKPTQPCNENCKSAYAVCVMNRDGNSSCKCIDHYKWIPDKKTCSIVGCKDSDCGEGGKCVIIQNRNDSLTNYQLPYRCECEQGYSLDPVRHLCKRGDIITCENDKSCGIGTCVVANNKNGFTCSCPGGDCFPSCNKTQCDPLAECRTATRDGKTVIAYCQCPEGYRGFGTVTTGCFPIQECDERLCSKYAACKLVNGSSTCVCDQLYTGNGTYCVDRDECADKTHNCDDLATCHNIQGGFNCICNAGYTGSGTRGNCKNINECDPTLRLSKCNITSTACNDLDGTYECVCKDGYRNTTYPVYQCPDINECLEGNHTCGKHDCINDVPGYECDCGVGYRLSADKRSCLDIDECLEETDDCHIKADCTNTEGSFTCICKEGYTGTGQTCEIIDKCLYPKDNRCKNDTTTCTMETGKPSYYCRCHEGYKPPPGQSEWSSCDDIDECLNGTLYDSTTTSCTNSPGSYSLQCRPGYVNEHPYPSEQNASCVARDECAEDPAWLENKALLESGKVNPADWKTWMIPPKNPDSGFAFCYNEAKADRRFGTGSVNLPNCKNLDPNTPMKPMNTGRNFTPPLGFTCACPNGEFDPTADSRGLYSVVCQNAVCNCNPGLICKEAKCICLDPKHHLRTVNDIAVCVTEECGTDYTVPDRLKGKAQWIRCNNTRFEAMPGFRLVRDNATREVIDVVDIDECTESKVDPCCSDRASCTGDYCVQCQNIEGSYTCAYRVGNSNAFCDRGSADPNTCKCNQPACSTTQSWYYSCQNGCNATLDKRLDDPKYNREVCSRVFDQTTRNFVTFPSLKNLYEYTCSLNNTNQNQLGCYFDKTDADLSKSPLFNYWGPCKYDIVAVKCEDGAKAKLSYVSSTDTPNCPARHTPLPLTPAVGQPIGQGYPYTPQCMQDGYTSYYVKGDFYLDKDSDDGYMILAYD